MADFYKAVKQVLGFEGGWSDDPDDSGGKTKYGITEAVAKNHGLNVETITQGEAENIYLFDYWRPCKANELSDQRLATIIFDTAVNCGVSRAVKIFQAVLNDVYDCSLLVDGDFGPITLRTFREKEKYSKGIIMAYLVKRYEYYFEIVRLNAKNEKFLKGWLNRLGEL